MSDEIGDGFVVVDLETTGLDCRKDKILEIGISVYDNELNLRQSMSRIVLNEGWRTALAANPYVWEMHIKSGLIHDVESHELAYLMGFTPRHIEIELINFLTNESDCGLKSGQNPITGSSVEFDRRFLREYMPTLEAWFHHRSIDVSTVKELCRRWSPKTYAELERQREGWEKKHRVLSDIEATMQELRFYRDNFIDPVDFDHSEGFLIPDQPVLPGM